MGQNASGTCNHSIRTNVCGYRDHSYGYGAHASSIKSEIYGFLARYLKSCVFFFFDLLRGVCVPSYYDVL